MRLQFEPEKNLKAVLVTQSCLTLCDPMDCSHQAPLSIEFSRQEYWSGLPFLSLGDLTNLVIKLGSPTLQAESLPSEPRLCTITALNLLRCPMECFQASSRLEPGS